MKPPNASFKIRKIEPEAIAIDDTFGTVAFITRQGYGDWISAIPGDPKPRIEFLEKETHLGLIRGLKFNLHCPHLAEELHEPPKAELIDGGVCVSASSRDACGNFQATHRGILSINPATGRYEWDFDTAVRYVGKTPARLPLDRIEFNNICPNGAWRCFLMPGEKRFDCTLVTDLQDKVWEFPHQHCLHYGEKFDRLRFGNRSLAGFFGEDLNPVVEVRESPLELTWGICDMFFDLHCLARTLGPVAPGTEWVWKYAIKYLDRRESEPFLGISQRIPLAFSDFESAAAPRVDIGMNDFSRPARIDRSEDVSWFRPAPPARRWDPKGGKTAGALSLYEIPLLLKMPGEWIYAHRFLPVGR